jgi:hypothetical protein
VDRSPIELLLYGALFVIILLFNFLTRKLKQPPQGEGVPDYVAIPETPREEPYEAPEEFWGRVQPEAVVLPPVRPVAAERVPRPRPAEMPSRRRPHYTRATLIGSKRDLKRAIVMMTVLGPCRADERSERPHI